MRVALAVLVAVLLIHLTPGAVAGPAEILGKHVCPGSSEPIRDEPCGTGLIEMIFDILGWDDGIPPISMPDG